jgi:hypothetical protein
MSARVTVTADAGGAVAVKTATTADEIDDLADEAERLLRARHPGVVVVLDHRRTSDGSELRTRFAGEPIERWHGSLARLAGLVAAVATDLGDLHDLGIVHGHIDGSHVLVGGDGRPRLCGFSPPSDESSPEDDVAALAELLSQLVERTRDTERRAPVLWRRGPVANQRAVAQIVAQATDPIPSRRPHARNLANLVLASFPGAELPPPEASSPPPPSDEPGFDAVFGDQTEATVDDIFGDRPWTPAEPVLARPAPDRRRHHDRPSGGRSTLPRVTLTTGLASAALVAVCAFALRGDAAATGADDDPAAAAAAESSPPTTAAAPDIAVDGSVVEIDGERWTVGQPGDLVAVGDWDCDGTVTPASYRPATGDVFVFTTWAADGEPLTVEAVAQVADGRSLVVDERAGPTGCDVPVVELASGQRQTVEVTP